MFPSNGRCSHTTKLALEESGGLPKLARLEPCSHRHLSLLFLLEPDGEVCSPSRFPDGSPSGYSYYPHI